MLIGYDNASDISGFCNALGTHTRYHVRTTHRLPHHTNLAILLKNIICFQVCFSMTSGHDISCPSVMGPHPIIRS